MKELTDAQKAEYFRKSYTSVDGLWFMMVEEISGFEEALEVDRRVWSIFPKIQARTLRSMLDAEKGIGGLKQCLSAKHSAEGFGFEIQADTTELGRESESGLKLIIRRCPWHELMAKSGRLALSESVGSAICNAEYATWAAEFSDDDKRISFCLESQICKGDETCALRFDRSDEP